MLCLHGKSNLIIVFIQGILKISPDKYSHMVQGWCYSPSISASDFLAFFACADQAEVECSDIYWVTQKKQGQFTVDLFCSTLSFGRYTLLDRDLFHFPYLIKWTTIAIIIHIEINKYAHYSNDAG